MQTLRTPARQFLPKPLTRSIASLLLAVSWAQAQEQATPTELLQKPALASLNAGSELPAVVVTGAIPAYVVPTTTTATRLETPNRDIPRAIQVIPREVIDDRGIVRAGELADNVPGVQQSTGYGGLANAEYFLRGFLSNSTYRDGFRDFAFLTPIDLAGVERVEFLKGPASVLYGQNQPGGVVNIVSKRPLNTPRYAGEVTVGSNDFYRGTLDLSGPLLFRDTLTKTIDPKGDAPLAEERQPVLSYRLNGAYENAGSYRDYNESESYTVSPSFTWNITPQTTLWVFGDYQHYEYTFDRALLPEPETFRLPISRFLGTPDAFAHTSAWRAGYELVHHFNDDWQFRSALAAIQSEQRSKFVQGFNLEADRRTLPRTATARHEKSENYTLQNEVSGKFSTGPIEHHALVGVELSRYRFSYDIGDTDFAPIDIFNPSYHARLGDIPYDPKTTYGADMVGVYLQDQIKLLENLKVSLAGRYDSVDTIENYRPAPKSRTSDTAFSPQVGVVYQPWEPVSVFASWSRSFNPNFGVSRSAAHFDPEEGEQYEVGVKVELLNKRLAGTVAAYHITKENVLTTDPTDPNFSILTGEQKSRGLEADLIGQPIDGWRIIASYGYTDATVSADNSIPVGDRLSGVPEHQFGLWTSYELQTGALRGFGAGAGAYYASAAEATLPYNGVNLPSYWRFDASLFYKREHWKAQINFKNLTDEIYYASQGYSVTPQAPFTVLASLGFEF